MTELLEKNKKLKRCIECGREYFGTKMKLGNGWCPKCARRAQQMPREHSYKVASTGENLGQIR